MESRVSRASWRGRAPLGACQYNSAKNISAASCSCFAIFVGSFYLQSKGIAD